MDQESMDQHIQGIIARIEQMLGWGKGAGWSTNDFEILSEKIFAKTNTQLSVITLKRIWGNIRYDSKPTITTLNALAEFAGYENWQSYRQSQLANNSPELAATLNGTKRSRVRLILLLSLAIGAGFITYFTAFDVPPKKPDPAKFTFTSKKVVDAGVPNTVIFDFDAAAASEEDTVMIQQSWDPKLSVLVERQQNQHSSIYYHPGFFDARLKVGGIVVKTHKLLIKSNGWLPLVDTAPVPVYFKPEDIFQDGYLSLPISKIKASGIVLQPHTPWTGYYNVGDFPVILSDDFVFETRFKNDFGEGAAACRHTELHVLFEGASMVLPLCVPGCVSELDFGEISGRKRDLSMLGVALENWVDVKFTVRDSLAQVYVNSRKAFDLNAKLAPIRWIGMVFKFQGSGSVDFVRISRKNGQVLYQENFDYPRSSSNKPVSLQRSH